MQTFVLRFTANVPGELSFRDLIGSVVRDACRRIEHEFNCIGLEWRLVSAFNEAFNNIVEHAYADCSGDVEVVFSLDDGRVVLRLSDQGDGFNFDLSGASDTPPELESLSEGGMGLFIIRQSMSTVTYERRQDRNFLTMTKHIADCAQSSEAPLKETSC